MPLFSRLMSNLSPSLLRSIRIRLFLPISRIEKMLPASGTVLDVGCGYGHVASFLAERNPHLHFVGIDPDENAIRQAKALWKLPNVNFEASPIESVEGQFDRIMFLDVLHHMTREQERSAVAVCPHLLANDGQIIIKEMHAGRCSIGVFLDTYISRVPPMVRTEDDLRESFCRFKLRRQVFGRRAGIGYVIQEFAF